MISFPKSTEVNRRIPKKKFYEHLPISADVKKHFISDIDSIIWLNKLSVDTMNVEPEDAQQELEVFRIVVTCKEYESQILQVIARGIPYKILFELRCGELVQYAFYSGKLYRTPWSPADEVKLEARGQSIPAIWEGFVEQIALAEEKPAAAPMSIEERLRRQEQIAKLRKDIAKLETRTRKEIQPKKKFELYQQVQMLKKQLEEIE